MHRLPCLCLSLLLWTALAPPAHADPPLLLPPQATERFVEEPVYQSRVRIVEAGREHPETVVLVHGLGDVGAGDWYGVIPRLAEQFHVIAFDLPGFAKSEKRNVGYTPLLYAAFIKWLVDAEVHKPFVLVGHSMGGAISLRYASIWPGDLRRLVLVDAAGILHRNALAKALIQQKVGDSAAKKGLRWFAGRAAEDVGNVPMDLSLIWGAETARRLMLGGNASKTAALALIDEDYSRLIGKVRVPTQLLWGGKDNIAPLRTSRLLVGRLPDVRLQVLADSGHEPMHDQPELFLTSLLAAIAQPLPAAIGLPEPSTSDRVGVCNGEADKVFTGAWARIELRDCTNVRIVDASVRTIDAEDSDLTIEHSRIQGGAIGIRLKDSELTATGLYLRSPVGLDLDDSRLDLAGADIESSRVAIQTHDKSTGLFSACRVVSPFTTGGLHGQRSLTSDQPL